MKPFSVVTSRVAYQLKQLSVIEDEIELPSGKKTTHATVKHNGAVVILPITDDERVLFVRQYRHSIKKYLLELPAGALNLGEDPLTCAARELQEETGHNGEVISLGHVFPAPGFCSELQHLFLARNLFPSSLPQDEDEIIEVEAVKLCDMQKLILDGTVEDGKSIVAITKAQMLGHLRCF